MRDGLRHADLQMISTIKAAHMAQPTSALAAHSKPVRQATAGSAELADRLATRSSLVALAMARTASNIARLA